jgi:hypothetical protein
MRSIVSRLTLVLVSFTFLLAAADLFSGTWKLNTAKSKFNPGPGPKSSIWTYSQDGDWIVLKVTSVTADGTSVDRTNRYKLDGSSYPFDGPLGPSKITVKKIDDHTSEATIRYDAGGTTTTHTVISKDGKTRTQTVTGAGPKGEKLNSVLVYDRQ